MTTNPESVTVDPEGVTADLEGLGRHEPPLLAVEASDTFGLVDVRCERSPEGLSPDDVVGRGVDVHVERMSDREVVLEITSPRAGFVYLVLRAEGDRLWFSAEAYGHGTGLSVNGAPVSEREALVGFDPSPEEEP